MAKLSTMQMRKDDGEKQIRCLIVEDYKSGSLLKHYNPQEFKSIIKNTNPDFLTKIYSPTQKDKENIYQLIDKNLSASNGQLHTKISDEDVVVTLIKNFTNVEIDVEDVEVVKEIIANPNELFLAIKMELDKILMSMLETYVTTYKTLQANPQTMEALGEKAQERLVQQKKLEREKKMNELKKELSKLVEENEQV